MSLKEKLTLVGFGAAIGGVVAGVVVWATRPEAPAVSPGVGSPGASTDGLRANARPAPLPPLGASPGEGAATLASVSSIASASPTAAAPVLAPIDAALAAEGTAAKRATPEYQAYRTALEAAAPRLRTLGPEEQSLELSRLAEKLAPKPPP